MKKIVNSYPLTFFSSRKYEGARSNLIIITTIASVVLLPLLQVITARFYAGEKVDESELVLYAVGFLGGDLNPAWDGYGHLGMYLLGAIYYIDGLISIAVSHSSSLLDYASTSLDNGRFYIVARLFLATLAMISFIICAKVIVQHKGKVWLAMMFVLLLALSPTTIYFDNYVRTDTLVMLFTVSSLFVAVNAKSTRSALCLSLVMAAAVACKISALPIVAMLFIVLLNLYLKDRMTIVAAVLVALSCPVFIVLLSPYMDYLGLVKLVASSEIGGGGNHFVRAEYLDIMSKLQRIFDFHASAVGVPILVLSALSLIGLFNDSRRLVVYTWLMLFFTIIPYLFGTTLRDYWFLPAYLLAALLAFLTLGMLADLLERRLEKKTYQGLVLACVLLVILGPGRLLISRHLHLIDVHASQPDTNKESARKWLESNHVGKTPILIDRHFLWIYPQVYDPTYLSISRDISRLFIYDRARNEFLSAVLEYKLYGASQAGTLGKGKLFPKLKSIRLSFDGHATKFDIPELCSAYSKRCVDLQLVNTDAVSDLGGGSAQHSLMTKGKNSHAIFEVNQIVPVDRTYYFHVSTDADKWRIFYDFGEGFSEKMATKFYSLEQDVEIRVNGFNPIVNLLGVADRPKSKVGLKERILFVTSPAGYGRFEKMLVSSKNESKINQAKVFTSRYREITMDRPIVVFDKGAGPIIEVYEIPESLRR